MMGRSVGRDIEFYGAPVYGRFAGKERYCYDYYVFCGLLGRFCVDLWIGGIYVLACREISDGLRYFIMEQLYLDE